MKIVMNTFASDEQIQEALQRLDAWIESECFKGWDPHDALNSPIVKSLTFGNRWLSIAWVQLFRRSPVNWRPLLRVPKKYNPKGMGLFLSSYLRKYQATGDAQYLDRVHFFASWLHENTSPGYNAACWGYPFDWPNRGFFAPAGTPTVVNTAFIGLAFLDLHRAFGDQFQLTALQQRGSKHRAETSLSIARSACDFIIDGLNHIRMADDELCFSYTPLDRRCVHNANLMGARLLAEVYVHTKEADLAQYALRASRYTVRRQRADGSWPYGEAANDGWVDNFHTGFVLVALRRIAFHLGTDEFDSATIRGYRFWREHMFLSDGTPKYFPDRTYPVDSHSVAQAILTFLEFADVDPEAMKWARTVAGIAIERMQDPRGFFHYQVHRHYRIRIPYMRWSQAWTQHALTELIRYSQLQVNSYIGAFVTSKAKLSI